MLRTITRVAEIVTRPASFVLQPSLLFRRQLFLDVGGLDADLHYTMDYELWIRMFAAARATRYLPEVIARARYHVDAKSIAAMARAGGCSGRYADSSLSTSVRT